MKPRKPKLPTSSASSIYHKLVVGPEEARLSKRGIQPGRTIGTLIRAHYSNSQIIEVLTGKYLAKGLSPINAKKQAIAEFRRFKQERKKR